MPQKRVAGRRAKSGQRKVASTKRPPTRAARGGTEIPTAPLTLHAGTLAPDFELQDDGGQTRRLRDFRGKPLILYFYPADDTPGCTKEACNFRDDYSEYMRAGVAILGVSPDSVKSHAKFRAKYQLPFPLLADIDRQTCTHYGVWGTKTFMGRSFQGVLRTTFLIDKDGRIRNVFEQVRPAEHSAEVLAALRSL